MSERESRDVDVRVSITRPQTDQSAPFGSDTAIEGVAYVGSEAGVPFVGWLELMGILERAVLVAQREELPSQ